MGGMKAGRAKKWFGSLRRGHMPNPGRVRLPTEALNGLGDGVACMIPPYL
jgi:hypothetical protein